MGLYLKVILRDVDRNDKVRFVRGDNFLKREYCTSVAEMEAKFEEMMV